MAKDIFNFDFSKMDLYKNKCPLCYKKKYIEKRIPRVPPNFYYALPGIVIQKIFEHFYNDFWYRKKDKCKEYMLSRAPKIFRNTLEYCNVDWDASISKKSKNEVYEEFLDMIEKNINTIVEHKLIGIRNKSEHKTRVYLGEDSKIGLVSKIDFLIETKEGVQILDGKATSNKSTYTKDPLHLIFYALCFKLRYRKLPHKIGYWFWRDGTIKYIDFTEDDVNALKEEIMDVVHNKIFKSKFPANPNYKSCLFCDYKLECGDRTRFIANYKKEKFGYVTKENLIT